MNEEERIRRALSILDTDRKQAMKRVVDALNKALEFDERAIHALCESRVPVNKPFADSDVPFVVFQDEDLSLHLGFIGVLSGCLMSALELPDNVRLCAMYEEDDTISRFYFIECHPEGHKEIEL